ncbi:MAG: isochorismatase family cysteine hydrolase [archaeon]
MKNLFCNVDTAKDFMYPDWGLPIPGAKKIIPNLKRLTEHAREKDEPVINPADWHDPDSEEISSNPDFVNTFPVHCIKYTKGAEFIPETNPDNPYVVDWADKEVDEEKVRQHRNIVIYKDKFDVFAGNSHTDRILDILNPDRVFVYGVATNVCVDQAVMGLYARGQDVYAVTDAMQGLPGIELPFDKWKGLGIKLVTTKDVLEDRL